MDGSERSVVIESGDLVLYGTLSLPRSPRGVVVFAHGSGSSRHSPRNIYVAKRLNVAGLGTLLLDLLTEDEERIDAVTRHLRFDIPFLASRLTAAIDWVEREPAVRDLPVGLFGASTGAAAALIAAVERPHRVKGVVSRGGRPDLALAWLKMVTVPVLLIVGGADDVVLELNMQALDELPGEKRLEIIQGASHLFEEAGTLEQVADLAAKWLVRYLAEGKKPAAS